MHTPFKDSDVLGRFVPDAIAALATLQCAHAEELLAAYERVAELDAMLHEARLQLEYLHEKFNPTGTTAAVLARIDAVLA